MIKILDINSKSFNRDLDKILLKRKKKFKPIQVQLLKLLRTSKKMVIKQ